MRKARVMSKRVFRHFIPVPDHKFITKFSSNIDFSFFEIIYLVTCSVFLLTWSLMAVHTIYTMRKRAIYIITLVGLKPYKGKVFCFGVVEFFFFY